MNILLLGPQGSGKGTQARLLVEKYNFFYFESGAFLREAASKNEELKKSLASGQLVPDSEMASYVESYLDEKGQYDNIIFDGFPRTITQYETLKNWFNDKNVKLDLVIVLKIDKETTIKRLSARRQDPESGKIYNLITDPPPTHIDPSKLIQREDDKPESIEKRLSWYDSLVLPLVDELKRETKVVEIDGERPIDEIQKDLIAEIEKLK